MKKILAIILLAALAVSFSACGSIKIPRQQDTADNGAASAVKNGDDSQNNASDANGEKVLDAGDFEITLPEGYHIANEYIPENSSVNIMITDKQDNIGISFIKEKISDFEGTVVTDLDSYLKVQHENVQADSVGELTEENGLKYFEYQSVNDGTPFKYFTNAVSDGENYWTIQCFCVADEYDQLKPDFIRWISSVRFH